MFDLRELPAGARVAIYGAGGAGRKTLLELERCKPDCPVLFFVDSFKDGEFEGRPVVSLDTFIAEQMEQQVDRLLISSVRNEEIEQGLVAAGVTDYELVDPYFWNYDASHWELDLYAELYAPDILEQARFYNVGASGFRHPYWTNIDYVQEHYAKHISAAGSNFINHDLMAGEPFPIEDNSAELMYSENTLEHIHADTLGFVLDEILRCLKPGGVFRLVLPNVDLFHRAFMMGDTHFDLYTEGLPMSSYFLTAFAAHAVREFLGREDDIKGILSDLGYEKGLDYFLGYCSIEKQRENPSGHINWFNPKKTVQLLLDAGFAQAAPCAFGQSAVPVLRNTHLFDHSRPQSSLYVEAVKG